MDHSKRESIITYLIEETIKEKLFLMNKITRNFFFYVLRAQQYVDEDLRIKRYVDILAYSLLKNHYHFVLRQNMEGGISKFMHALGTGYTKYFNARYEKTGALFQRKYKFILIKENNLLRFISYANNNHAIHETAPSFDICSGNILLEKRENFLQIVRGVELFDSWSHYRNFSGNHIEKVIEERKAGKHIDLVL